jgi:hypothetical protein
MRVLPVAGVVLMAVGAWIVFRPPSYSTEQSVFKLGDLEARVQQQRPVPGWMGGIALGAGVVLLIFGLKRS